MDSNKKSLIKNTVLGLLSGGALAALYAANHSSEDEDDDKEFKENEIVVPLSRRNFMKSVRGGKTSKPTAQGGTKVPQPAASKDISEMTAKDLASLKRSILSKGAECCGKVSSTVGPSSTEMSVQFARNSANHVTRDSSGRFTSEKKVLGKSASGIKYDALGEMGDWLGFGAGGLAGIAAVKAIGTKILVNRKKRQVERSRKIYSDMLAKEVNDVDEPYYRKEASDRGFIGSRLGLLGAAMATTSLASAAVIYRIMENRRKAEEDRRDMDMDKYPKDKVIKFKFPEVKEEDKGFFG